MLDLFYLILDALSFEVNNISKPILLTSPSTLDLSYSSISLSCSLILHNLSLSLSLTFTYSYLKKFTYFVSHCLTGLDSTKQVNLLFIQHKQSSWIKTNKKEISSCTMIIGTSEKLLTSIIKQNWRQESIGVHVQNIQNFLIAYREPI